MGYIFEVPGIAITVTTAGGIKKIGHMVLAYCLRTNGATNAVLNLRANSPTGTVVWKDECISTDKAKPVMPRLAPLGVKTPDRLFVEVTGDGAECDLFYE